MRALFTLSILHLYVFSIFVFFFFNDTATTEIYTLSLHDALPISTCPRTGSWARASPRRAAARPGRRGLRSDRVGARSEEHTSELQSQSNLVCRLLLEKKKNKLKRNSRAWTTASDRRRSTADSP